MSETIHIRKLIENILDDYRQVDGIHIGHYPRGSEATSLQITIHSYSSQDTSKYSSYSGVLVEKTNDVAEYTYDVYQKEPVPQYVTGMSSTCVYIDESAPDIESIGLDAGLRMLGRKLDGICVSCGNRIREPHRHYTECKIKRG